ncbi:hypothetical protein MBLNU457_4187t1 [Dothideomycetes sp. NU457]
MSAMPAGKAVVSNDQLNHGKDQDSPDKRPNNATTGASAAGVRALTARLAAFYFRVPIKAFFRTRVDYLAYPRAINPLFQKTSSSQGWSWRMTTPGILAHAIKTYGWSFIPNQVLPPLLANVTIGGALYYTYLQSLGFYYEPASHATKRMYPPAPLSATFNAGVTAGFVQSLIAAPMDALTIRFKTSDLLEQRYKTMWHYAYSKVQSLGPRGVFAGWGLSSVKDSLSAGIFFASFEFVKAQCFYQYASWYYRHSRLSIFQKQEIETQRRDETKTQPIIRPHYLMEPSFLLLAGASASVLQQVVLYPLSQIQEIHFKRLAGIDSLLMSKPSRLRTIELYGKAYMKTWKQCKVQARRSGGWFKWLYADFWMSTLRQVPSTSAGLIVFEVFRRKYGLGTDAVKINMNGYDILLP